jgi:hypothetical protein
MPSAAWLQAECDRLAEEINGHQAIWRLLREEEARAFKSGAVRLAARLRAEIWRRDAKMAELEAAFQTLSDLLQRRIVDPDAPLLDDGGGQARAKRAEGQA